MKNEEKRAQTTEDEKYIRLRNYTIEDGRNFLSSVKIFFIFILFFILNCIIINALISTLKNQSLSYDIFAMIGFCGYI